MGQCYSSLNLACSSSSDSFCPSSSSNSSSSSSPSSNAIHPEKTENSEKKGREIGIKLKSEPKFEPKAKPKPKTKLKIESLVLRNGCELCKSFEEEKVKFTKINNLIIGGNLDLVDHSKHYHYYHDYNTSNNYNNIDNSYILNFYDSFPNNRINKFLEVFIYHGVFNSMSISWPENYNRAMTQEFANSLCEECQREWKSHIENRPRYFSLVSLNSKNLGNNFSKKTPDSNDILVYNKAIYSNITHNLPLYQRFHSAYPSLAHLLKHYLESPYKFRDYLINFDHAACNNNTFFLSERRNCSSTSPFSTARSVRSLNSRNNYYCYDFETHGNNTSDRKDNEDQNTNEQINVNVNVNVNVKVNVNVSVDSKNSMTKSQQKYQSNQTQGRKEEEKERWRISSKHNSKKNKNQVNKELVIIPKDCVKQLETKTRDKSLKHDRAVLMDINNEIKKIFTNLNNTNLLYNMETRAHFERTFRNFDFSRLYYHLLKNGIDDFIHLTPKFELIDNVIRILNEFNKVRREEIIGGTNVKNCNFNFFIPPPLLIIIENYLNPHLFSSKNL